METDQFDALTRTLSTADSSRRQALRAISGLLLSGAFGSVAAKLGLNEDVTAKAKKHGKQRRDRKESGPVHAAGKHHKKHKHKHHKTPKDPPQLCDTICTDEGGRCCPNGSCVDAGACCYPDEKTCPDGSCAPADSCCFPEERTCDDRSCIPHDQCCDDEQLCSNGACLPKGVCCDGEQRCADGSCILESQCCPDAPPPSCGKCEEVVCDNGTWTCHVTTDCPPGAHWNEERCQCEFCEEDCGDPWNDLCRWPGCQDGEQCVQGICQAACPDPRFPQLSCVKDAYNGSVRCYCGFPGEITFNCGNNVCGCGPGSGVCCDPNNIHTPHCPEACYCPGA